MARSEASTAEWYIKDECIGFVIEGESKKDRAFYVSFREVLQY